MSEKNKLTAESAFLVLIDMQERLFPAMHDRDKLLQNVTKLVRGMNALGVPVILTEQYPRGLGATLKEVTELLPGVKPVEKVCFSCWDEGGFRQALKDLTWKRKQALIAGIEAHVCVYQTAMDLMRSDYQVQVVADCVSSRDKFNRKISLKKMGKVGILPTTAEMALFELLGVAQGDTFKQISNIVK